MVPAAILCVVEAQIVLHSAPSKASALLHRQTPFFRVWVDMRCVGAGVESVLGVYFVAPLAGDDQVMVCPGQAQEN